MNAKYKRALAIEIAIWFWSALGYLRPEAWTFAVDKTGQYLPGTEPHNAPPPFVHRDGDWHLFLQCDPWDRGSRRRKPHRKWEVEVIRDTLHRAVSCSLHNLVGSATANKLLKEFREAHNLKVLREKEIFIDE
jgi:hypothetical protein